MVCKHYTMFSGVKKHRKTLRKEANTMKIRNILKVFFFHKEEPVELDLTAAEIREGKAYLHPKNELGVTYLVRSNDIEISLSKGLSLSPENIIKIEPKSKQKKPEDAIKRKTELKDNKTGKSAGNGTSSSPVPDSEFDKYKKRKFVVSLYPDEYDSVMSSMKEYGYRRADFLLACVNTATKGTMEREHKKIVKAHNALRKEEKALLDKHRETAS